MEKQTYIEYSISICGYELDGVALENAAKLTPEQLSAFVESAKDNCIEDDGSDYEYMLSKTVGLGLQDWDFVCEILGIEEE